MKNTKNKELNKDSLDHNSHHSSTIAFEGDGIFRSSEGDEHILDPLKEIGSQLISDYDQAKGELKSKFIADKDKLDLKYAKAKIQIRSKFEAGKNQLDFGKVSKIEYDAAKAKLILDNTQAKKVIKSKYKADKGKLISEYAKDKKVLRSQFEAARSELNIENTSGIIKLLGIEKGANFIKAKWRSLRNKLKQTLRKRNMMNNHSNMPLEPSERVVAENLMDIKGSVQESLKELNDIKEANLSKSNSRKLRTKRKKKKKRSRTSQNFGSTLQTIHEYEILNVNAKKASSMHGDEFKLDVKDPKEKYKAKQQPQENKVWSERKDQVKAELDKMMGQFKKDSEHNRKASSKAEKEPVAKKIWSDRRAQIEAELNEFTHQFDEDSKHNRKASSKAGKEPVSKKIWSDRRAQIEAELDELTHQFEAPKQQAKKKKESRTQLAKNMTTQKKSGGRKI